MFLRNLAKVLLPKGRIIQRKVWLIGFILCILISISTWCLLIYGYTNCFATNYSLGFNYSFETEAYSKFGYIVDTPTCRILNVDPWDSALLPFLKPKHKTVECHSRSRQWTYTKGSELIINTTAMEETGHSLDSVTCCYMEISRIEDTEEDYTVSSDLQISFSKLCIPLTSNITEFKETEFIRVLCQGKFWPIKSDVLYRKFHAIPLHAKNSFVKQKIDYWKNRAQNRTTESAQTQPMKLHTPQNPPDFLILGIDSMSRLNFYRNMPKTKAILEKMGAVEMLGYTKVGENSFPNAVAFLSGYSEEDLKKVCYFSRETLQDGCPYIWKKFSDANYLTASIEDVPLLAAFNYLKTGFVKQPVDYYFRPFMLGVHGHSPVRTYAIDCIEDRTVDETVLKYIQELHELAREKKTPLFLYSWLTNLAHEDFNIDPFFDTVYANFLNNLVLDNTVLIVMSDHGYRFGEIRHTFPGWYEDKLPSFWIHLPTGLAERFPNWKTALAINSRRLTSPYDLYQTTSHILDTFVKPSRISGNDYKFPRKYGQSFFNEMPIFRTCENTGIPYEYCSCVPHRVDENKDIAPSNDRIAAQAADIAIKQLNSKLPVYCAPLEVSTIKSVALLNSTNHLQFSNSEGGGVVYVVVFLTQPGGFTFEAKAIYHSTRPQSDRSDPNFSLISNVIRMNRISTDVSCILDRDFESLCYCAFLLNV